MNEGPSNISGLQKEWSLLLHSFLGQSTDDEKIIAQLRSQDLTLGQIIILKKEFSARRKNLNQKIELIKNDIERLLDVIENLKLVGSSTSAAQSEINNLLVEGKNFSEEIEVIEIKLKKIHEIHDKIIVCSDIRSTENSR